MVLVSPMVCEKVWIDRTKYDTAERRYYERLTQSLASGGSAPEEATEIEKTVDEAVPTKQTEPIKKNKNEGKADKANKKANSCPRAKTQNVTEGAKGVTQNANSWNSLAGEVAKARQHIKNSLQCIDDIAVTSNSVNAEVTNRLVSLERENQELLARMEKMEKRLTELEKALERAVKPGSSVQTPSKPGQSASKKGPAPQPPKKEEPEDDGIDLFGSDSEEEDEEATRIKEQRLAEYAAKKSKKPALVAKSSIILDVKPWDDETDMKLLEQEVRKIACDGLLWGASKLVPLAYGIHKLQISCVVEDEKVSIDWLQETIQEIEDYVQSVDIAAFNKI